MLTNNVRNTTAIVFAAAVAVLTSCGGTDGTYGAATSTQTSAATAEPPHTTTVRRVIDGDTLVTSDGTTVRLVGIDTPERGQPCAAEATRNLQRLTNGATITLTPATKRATDRYGRALAYVDTSTVDAGLSQIKAGLAVARYDSRDGYGPHPREATYVRADKATKTLSCN